MDFVKKFEEAKAAYQEGLIDEYLESQTEPVEFTREQLKEMFPLSETDLTIVAKGIIAMYRSELDSLDENLTDAYEKLNRRDLKGGERTDLYSDIQYYKDKIKELEIEVGACTSYFLSSEIFLGDENDFGTSRR